MRQGKRQYEGYMAPFGVQKFPKILKGITEKKKNDVKVSYYARIVLMKGVGVKD